jgi:hypothetical protein
MSVIPVVCVESHMQQRIFPDSCKIEPFHDGNRVIRDNSERKLHTFSEICSSFRRTL